MLVMLCEVDLKPEDLLAVLTLLYIFRDNLEECTSSRAEHKTCALDGMSARSRIVIRPLSLLAPRDGVLALLV